MAHRLKGEIRDDKKINTNKRYIWIVGVCDSECDGVDLSRVYGTENEVRQHLLNLAQDIEDPDELEDGPTSLTDIQKEMWNGATVLKAFNNYFDHHCDFTAMTEPDPEDLTSILD